MKAWIFIVWAMLLLMAVPAVAEESVPSEAERWQVVQRVLSTRDLRMHRISSYAEKRKPGFCTRALKDLQSGRGVEIIEPVIQTNDPDHPALERYRACKKHWGGSPPPELGLDSLSTLGYRAFRLYRIDLDRNPESGLEEIIAAELDDPRNHAMSDHAIGFHVIDRDACVFKEGASVWMPQELGVLVRYRGYYRVLQLHAAQDQSGPNRLTMWNFKSSKLGSESVIPCTWITADN